MNFELDNVELSFSEKPILYGVYIKAETGKITGILGSNGSGKSSLLKIFFGSLPCNNKLIRVNGKGTLKRLYTAARLRFLPQDDFLPSHINLRRIFKIYRVSWEDFILKFPGFEIYRKYKLKELSGGEKRLVATWLTLKADSELVLLDEPFTHLTPVFTEIIKKELELEKEKKAIILTDHLYGDLLEISDDVYFIKDGCSRQIQNTSELAELGYISPY